MKCVKFLAFAVVCFAFLFLNACTMPLVVVCRDIATKPPEKNGTYFFTEEQARAACVEADKFLAGKKSDEEKGGVWQIDNARLITTEEVLKYIRDLLASTDILLSYRNDETARDIDFWKGFREGLLKKEKELRWVEQRLNYVINYNEFIDKAGEIDSEVAKKLLPYGRKAYSLRLLYPIYDLTQLKFTADYVESAKKDGTLMLVGEFPIVEKKEFAEKVINKSDPNKFSWKKYYRGWLIKAYKSIPVKEQPAVANADYLEIFKAKFNSQDNNKFAGFEEQFAVAGFKSRGKDMVNIFVIDYDLNVISGFSPDKILETFINVVFGNEVYINDFLRKEVLEVLYNPPIAEEKEHRKKPPEKPLYVEIKKTGEIDNLALWEEGDFTVPFSYSGHGPGKYSASPEIIWEKFKNAEDKIVEEEHGLKKIEAFKIAYSSAGNVKVIEFYAPKKDFSHRDIKEGVATYNTIRIRRKDLPQAEADVKFFAKEIKLIQYEYSGRWYEIMDKDGDGKFEKRRKIADPTEKRSQSSSYPGPF